MTRQPPRTVAVLGILGLLLLTLAAWLFVVGPRLSTADDLAKQADDTTTANIQLRSRYNQTLQQVAAAPQKAAEAQALFASMPRAAELPTVLRQISDAATRAGIDVSDIQVISTSVPAAVGPAGAGAGGLRLARMDVGITVLATRPLLLDFIDNLQALDRALLITGNQFTGSRESSGVAEETLQVTGSMFVLESELPDLAAQVQALIDAAELPPEQDAPAG